MRNFILVCICTFIGGTAFAQFPSVDWQYYTGAPSFGSAAAADMDNDGFYEIVFTTYTNDGRAHCLNAEDGSVKWIYNIGGCGDVAPLICDVDNDDTLDVIINGSCNPTIFCINGATGQLKWSKPSGGGDSPPTMANMDNDTMPEILFCNFNGELRILNGEDGTTNKIIQVDPYFNPIQTEPTIVDVNNDGNLDIIMANHYNISGLYVWAYDYATEDTIWTNYMSDSSTYNAYHGGAVADVDGDGMLEYVIGSNNGLVRALNVEDGSVLWSVPIPQSDMAPVSIADLDGDGDLEVVVTNNDWITYDERIWVLKGSDGSVDWSYATTFSSFRGCAIADINGNDTLDLVAGYYMGDVIAVEPYNGLIWQTNLLPYFPSGLPYFMVDHGPLVADFDHNGTMDVFVVGGYGTYTPDSMNTGKAFMIEAGNGQCPEWLMFRQDVTRSGYLSPQDAAASCSEVLSVPASENRNEGMSVFPNPAIDELTITGESQFNSAEMQITIYNVFGQAIEVPRAAYTIGKNSIQLNLATLNLATGTYVIAIKTGDTELKKKFVLTR
jgi:outer membrane protein assembly factor BamB